MIRVQCPHCRSERNLSGNVVGKTIRCPQCGVAYLVSTNENLLKVEAPRPVARPGSTAAVPPGLPLAIATPVPPAAAPPPARPAPAPPQPVVVIMPVAVLMPMSREPERLPIDSVAELRFRRQRSNMNGLAILAILVIAAFALGGTLLAVLMNAQQTQPRRSAGAGASDAEVIDLAKTFVRERLKAPRDAKFIDDSLGITKTAKNEWLVTGQVDSQNGFGVFLRGTFEVQIEYLPPPVGRYRLVELYFNGESLK